MARKLRIQYAGAMYHVMNRGDHGENIFHDDQDRGRFLTTPRECCEKTGWQGHRFCLRSNHFHCVVETPNANLVVGMKWLLGTYTKRFNGRYQLLGHLFSGRYKALLVDGSSTGYLKTACDCVHLNPVRAGLLKPEEPLQTYRWSSDPWYISDEPKPGWWRMDRLLGAWGIRGDQPGAGRHFGAAMEARRQSELEQEFQPLRRGWCLGSEQFRADMLKYIDQQKGQWHYGKELRESAEDKAERMIGEAPRSHGVGEDELRSWPKGHPFLIH